MGQSQGGIVALSIARYGADEYVFPGKPKFQGIVAYYPGCGHVSDVRPVELVSPLLVLAGEKDDWTPPLGCVLARENVSGADYEVIVYDQAHHAFDLNIPVGTYANHTGGGNIWPKIAPGKEFTSVSFGHIADLQQR